MKKQAILERDAWGKYIKANRPKVSSEAPPLRKYFTTTVDGSKDVNPETGMRLFTFVASTGAVDREGDVLFQDGWDLDNFKANPVILWAHESWEPPIGKAASVGVDGDNLKVTIEFTPSDVNPDGYRIYKLVEAGFVSAVSVGFKPRKWVWNDEHNGYDFLENELLEISVVPVPANQEALLAAGLDAQTAKWYAGLTKGAAAAVVMDEIIKTAIDYNRSRDVHTTEPEIAAGTQCMYVHTVSDDSAPEVVFMSSTGQKWVGSAWKDAAYGEPWELVDAGESGRCEIVLPDEFGWPPEEKEVDMTLEEKLQQVLDALEGFPEQMKTALADAVDKALASMTVKAEDEPPVADNPATKEPEGDVPSDAKTADDAAPADADEDDDDVIEIEGLDDEGLRDMVVTALDQARTATTGRLPD